MRSKASRWIVGGLSVFFLLSSLLITVVEYNQFSSQPTVFPHGSAIAGIPVDNLDIKAAEERLMSFYALPQPLIIDGKVIHADPLELGFSFDPASLVTDAASQIEPGSFWGFLRGQEPSLTPVEIPLNASVDDSQIQIFLKEQILPRYDQPGSPVTPMPGTTHFLPGEPGQSLLIDQAVDDIRAALLSSEVRSVPLAFNESPASPPSLETLEAFLRHNIDWIGFNDLVEFYLESMVTREVLHFAVRGGEAVPPDVAFTAASTIKIPIMISVLRRTAEPTPEPVVTLMRQMIAFSENPPADTLMSTYLDEVRGPLMVSEDLAELGMENTFLAGYFYLGAPLLQRFDTPANARRDVFLNPDIYNQTVPSETGRLLAAIYTCAQDGSGLLTETFPGEITQSECQLMIDILAANRIGLLIEAGLPFEATAAHKHGWVQELDGQLRSMSDVAIVFTEGADYVLNIFIYDSVRLDFDQGNRLFARLSQTVYNFFNLNEQTYWWFD
jgi:beta-lactamase class A